MANSVVVAVFRRPLTIATVLVLAACSPATTPASVPTTTPAASPTPATSPPASPSFLTPSPSATLFGTCQLPVEVPGSPPLVGWLGLPGGLFSPDSSSAAATSRSGYVAWDSIIGKWLPTQPWMISPDGASYVSQDTATIEIGDARTGTVLRSIPPGNYDSVIAYTATGIYAYHTGEQVIPGLWKIDPSTGRVTQLQSSSTPVNWSLVDDNVAWGTYTTPDNVTAVMRLDLSTGVMTNIYQPAGQHDAAVVGLVGSGVMVVVESFGNAGLVSAIVVNDDGSTAPVAVPGTLLDKTFTHRLQDGSAIIFSGLGYGVAAYDPDHGLQLLIDTPQDMFLLGRCRPQ